MPGPARGGNLEWLSRYGRAVGISRRIGLIATHDLYAEQAER